MSRIGDWIQTFSGVEFYPLDPRPDEIRIEDIAHALSMQCRYSGHVRRFYSVAEHSIRVADMCHPDHALWGLLHDASEAYLVDLPGPLKHHSDIGRLYREAEEKLMKAVCERFGLAWPVPEPVARVDKAMLWFEARDLMPHHPYWEKWMTLTTGVEFSVEQTMPAEVAEQMFLTRFGQLKGF